MVELTALLIGALVFVALIGYSTFSWGYVLHVMYGWFILSAIPTLPHFTVLHFVGFSLFANALVRHSSDSIKSEYKDKSKESLHWISPWLTLLVAWIVHSIWF